MNSPLAVLADRELPGLASLSWDGIQLELFEGQPSAEQLSAANALLCRSTLRVDERLLSQSSLGFVGTATAGIDHIDTGLLDRAGIHLANAPGCNANAVVDYVMSALCSQFDDSALLDSAFRIGIVGAGQVGGRLAALLAQLGIATSVYDPLIDAGASQVDSLDALADCQVLSLHVPLTRTGAHPTQGLVDTALLRRCDALALFINTSRAEVLAAGALDALCDRCALALDVWPAEPRIELALVQRATIATPHIAGHSGAGKQRGVAQVLAALADHYRLPAPVLAVDNCQALPGSLTLSAYRAQLACKLDLLAMSEQFATALQPAQSLGHRERGDFIAQQFARCRRDFAGRAEFDYPLPAWLRSCDAQ